MSNAKEKQPAVSIHDLIADSAPETKVIEVGGHNVKIQELSGRDRFALASKAEENQWDVLLWVASLGLIEPSFQSVEELEQLKPEWIVVIANAVLELSGVSEDAVADAENESGDVIGIGGK